MIVKLAMYGFHSHLLSFVFSYLNERKQRTKFLQCLRSYSMWSSERVNIVNITCYIKLFCTGADRDNGILMSLLLLVAETIKLFNQLVNQRCIGLFYTDSNISVHIVNWSLMFYWLDCSLNFLLSSGKINHLNLNFLHFWVTKLTKFHC